MPDPELEDAPIEQQPAPDAAAAELGGFTNSEGKFEANFDQAIDGAFKSMAEKGNVRAAELVAESQTGPKGASGPAQAATGAQTGPTAVTGPAESQTGPTAAQTGATGAASGPTGAAVADDRDKDINDLASQLGDLEKRPKTKQIIEGYKGKVTQERNQREAAQRELAELKTQIEGLKKLPVPKEVDEELKALRDTVRELDASRDPAIKAKFDTKISANEDRIIGLLKENGFGLDANGKEIAGAIDGLKKSGLSRRTLQATIEKLEKSGDGGAIEAAEELKDILRANSQLAKEKEGEIAGYRAGAEERAKTEKVELERQVQAANKRAQETISEHVAKWDFLKVPPEPKPEDTPAVRAEKERARVAHNERVNKYNEAIRKETSSPTDTNITARVGLMYRDIIAPQLKSNLDAAHAEIATLKEQMKAMRGAGDLSRKISGGGAAKPTPREEISNPDSHYDDVVDAAARKMGILK